MKLENLIPIDQLCTHYKIEKTFFEGLEDYGLIEVMRIETSNCIHVDHIHKIEKMMRLHQDLQLNYEGIDTVLNLLSRIENLQEEVRILRNRSGIDFTKTL